MTKPAPQKLGGRVIVFTVLLSLTGLLSKAQTGVVMQTSFETSNVKTGFVSMENCCSYSLAQSSTQKKTGSSALRVELRKGDPDAQYGNKRAELTHNNYGSQSQVNANLRWWSWSNYFPSSSWSVDPAGEIFAQWHDKNPSVSTSPPLALEIKNGRYRVDIRYSLTNYTSNPNYVDKYFDLGPVGYDKWNDWAVYYDPQYNSNGKVKIWLNGKLVLDYTGPNFINGSWFPYFKIGVYKWVWSSGWGGEKSTASLRVYYVDDVKIGDKTASQSTFVSGTTTPTNTAPVANAGSDLFITLPTNTVTLNGSNSTDADGNISTYKWTKVSGPASGTLANSNIASTGVSGLLQGTYVFRLTTTDNDGATDTDDVTVTVASSTTIPNKAPIANAGTSKSITLPTNSAALSGAASTDPDGSISSYKWAQVSGPNTSTWSSTTSSNCTVSNLAAGTYSYRLTVTDNKGATATATVGVTVNAATGVNKAPIANAGSSKSITLPTNSTTLSGTGSSDPDGSISAYKWAQVSGPVISTLSSTTASGITVTNLTKGTYSYRLTVTDNKGATASATVGVTVNEGANKAPIANAGSNKSITLPTNSTTLSGTGSSDPDGSISSYKWWQVSGPSTSTLSSTTASGITVSNLVAGTYTYRLTVTDNGGVPSNTTVSVTVNPASTTTNKVPVVNAGVPKTITLPTNSVNLSSTSSDPDGTITKYVWSQVSGPNTAKINNTGWTAPIMSGMIAGIYTFKLTVTDNMGATASATTTVTVKSNAMQLPNEAPIAKTVGQQNLIGTSVTLNGADSHDSDGQITAYSWTQVSGPNTATLANQDKATAQASNMLPGTYVFQLEVTDDDGAKGKATLTLVVSGLDASNLPVARAGNDQTVILPSTSANLDGSASSDPNGTIKTYQWTKISGPGTIVIATGSQAKTQVSNLVAGTYEFKLQVTDNDNLTDADTVRVTVKGASSNETPVAVTNSDIDISLPVDSAKLDGSGSYDNDGKITLYQWRMINGSNKPVISNQNAAVTTVSGLTAGVYIFQLTVKDEKGAINSKQIKVTVRGTNGSAETSSLKTYPNPVSSEMTLRLDDNIEGKATVRIYSMTGIIVFTDVINKTGSTFIKNYDLGKLVSGSYVLSVQFENKPVVTKKIQKL